MSIVNEILTEKYRPKKFEDFLGFKNYQTIIDLCSTPFKLPHFLFVSRAGTGKTTFAKILINTLKADYLILNASDDTGIEVIRTKVKTFAKTMALNSSVPKIIFLDEADFLSKNSQASLRGIIEEFSQCRFILNANYEEKIIPELHSRLTRISFGNYEKKDILSHLIRICTKENINFEADALKKLIDLNYPDIREMIKYLQLNKTVTLDIIKSKLEMSDMIFSLIQQRKLLDARRIWIENNLDCKELLYSWFEKIINLNYSIQQKVEIIDLIALTDYRIAVSATPDIQLFNFCVKVKL